MFPWPLVLALIVLAFIVFSVLGVRLRALRPPMDDDDELEQS